MCLCFGDLRFFGKCYGNGTILFGQKEFLQALFLHTSYNLIHKLDLEVYFLKTRKKDQETKMLKTDHRQGDLKAQNNLIFVR